jgi:hypothetical protein
MLFLARLIGRRFGPLGYARPYKHPNRLWQGKSQTHTHETRAERQGLAAVLPLACLAQRPPNRLHARVAWQRVEQVDELPVRPFPVIAAGVRGAARGGGRRPHTR